MKIEEVKSEDNQEHLMYPLNEEFPSLNISPLLPLEIQIAIANELKKISSIKDKSPSLDIDSYHYKKGYVNRLSPTFDNPLALFVLNDLFKKSPDRTIVFIELLFDFENAYQFGVKFYKDKQQEIKDLKSQIRASENLFKVMSGRKSKANINTDLMFQLIQYQNEARRLLKETTFKLKNNSYFKNEYCPLSRKKNLDNALPIFFVRRIYSFFKSDFGSPMYSHIGKLIDVLFGLSWDDNEIKKHCKKINSFYRGVNSTKKKLLE